MGAKYLLSGLLTYGVCGGGLEARGRNHGKRRVVFYGCPAHHRRGAHLQQGQQILRRLIVGRLRFAPQDGGHYTFSGTGTVRPLLSGVIRNLVLHFINTMTYSCLRSASRAGYHDAQEVPRHSPFVIELTAQERRELETRA